MGWIYLINLISYLFIDNACVYMLSRKFYLHQNDKTVYKVYVFSLSKQDNLGKLINN